MELENLKCSVNGYTPTSCGSSFRYRVQLQYGDAKWEVLKRFSDFDTLLQTLQDAKFAALPSLPEKTLIAAPTDTETVQIRQRQLEIITHALLSRPDTRLCQALWTFLGFDAQTDVAARKLQPNVVRCMEDARFGVSDIGYSVEDNVIIVTQEDESHLSRLGRVWSVVEPDELGSLNVWCKTAEKTWKRDHTETFSFKVRCVCYSETAHRIFVGMEDGTVRTYQRDEESKIKFGGALDLHHRAPVTNLFCDGDRFISLGYDTAIRVVSASTLQVISGGRLAKRLNEAYLSAGILHQNHAILGTSEDDIFVYSVIGNPPQFRSQCKVVSGGPVNQFAIHGEELLVAHGDRISVYTVPDAAAGQLTRKAELRTSFLQYPEATIRSCCSNGNVVFGAYSNGAIVGWNVSESEVIFAIHAHSDGCRRILWLDAPWGPALMTAGGDGKVLCWTMPNHREFEVWRPRRCDASDGLQNRIGKSCDDDEQPISHAQQLVSNFTHHTGDSDNEEDDLLGAFA